jgi:phosphoglycerate dehydrogenase-like enzyme
LFSFVSYCVVACKLATAAGREAMTNMTQTDQVILLDPYPRPADVVFSAEDRRRLEALGRVVWYDGQRAPDSHIEQYLPEAVVVIGQTSMPRERLNRAPHLRLIANIEGNFLPNIDYEECHRRNIHVTTIAPVFGEPVAEMALGMALAAARGIVEGDAKIRQQREALFGTDDWQNTFLLRGKAMGLIGCGNLGRTLLPLLRPFQGEILVHDPWIHDQVLREMQVQPIGLDELFRRCRVVFILAPATTENAGSLGAKQFGLMRRGSVVVLVSRAGIVNFDGLLDAAESGQIRAAIDVFPEEPIPANHRARHTPNTILSAHRAGDVPEIMTELGRMVVDDVELVLRGLAPQRTQRASIENVTKYRSKPGIAG